MGLDRDMVAEMLDRLNALEVTAQIPGVIRAQPRMTATRLKENLMQDFDNYVYPQYTRAEYSQVANAAVQRKLRQARERELQERAQGNEVNQAGVDYWKANRQWTLSQDGATYGYDFQMERYNTERPLAFDGEVELKEYYDMIEYFSTSQSMSLPGTLRNLLNEAQRRGLDNLKLASLLYKFLEKYFPDQKTSALHFNRLRQVRELFGLAVELVNPEAEMDKIKKARSQLTRKVGDSISTVMYQVKSLCYQEIQLTTAGLDPVALERKSSELSQLSFKDFVTKETWALYSDYVYRRLTQNVATDLREGIRKIEAIEQDNTTFRPLVPLSIRSNKVLDPQSLRINKLEAGKPGDWKSRSSSPSGSGERKGRDFDKSRKFSDKNSEKGRYSRQGSGGDRRDQRGRSPVGRGFFGNRKSSSESFRSSRSRSWNKPYENKSGGTRSPSPGGGRFGRRGGSSPGFRRQSGGRDQSRGRQRDRSWSLGVSKKPDDRNSSGRRSFSSPKSPRTFGSRAKTPERGQCYRCMGGHLGRDCVRYPEATESPCSHCENRGIRLYHKPELCRFRKSEYRTPSPRTRENRLFTIQVMRGDGHLKN